MLRTVSLVILVAVAVLLAVVSPRGLAWLHVGINTVAGSVWLGFALITRKWPERLRGVPVWLVFLALGAAFLALAILEARQKLG